MSTFPEFKQREEQFGSLIKGMKYEKEQRQKQRQLYPGAPKGQFKQFRHGLRFHTFNQATKLFFSLFKLRKGTH